MRPPQFAGEDAALQAGAGVVEVASMRPPQFAGEDVAAINTILVTVALQ